MLYLIYKDSQVPKWAEVTVNICFVTFCTIMRNIPNISPDEITNLAGSICCFFFVYLYPIMLHLMCYHGTNKMLLSLKRKLRNEQNVSGKVPQIFFFNGEKMKFSELYLKMFKLIILFVILCN